MHRSRVSTFLIDVPRDEERRTAAFWSAALGAPLEKNPDEPEFTVLRDALPGFVTAVQAIDGEPRYHLDIETDDVDAEVTRLVELGATEVSSWQGCRTLRAPGGHLLCVIPVHTTPEFFAANATTWP
jgi:hypothetical protein